MGEGEMWPCPWACSGPKGLVPFAAGMGAAGQALTCARILCPTTPLLTGSDLDIGSGASPEDWLGRFVFLHLVTSSAQPGAPAGPHPIFPW